jgi:hypothetical protein
MKIPGGRLSKSNCSNDHSIIILFQIPSNDEEPEARTVQPIILFLFGKNHGATTFTSNSL